MSILDRHRDKFLVELGGPLTNGQPCWLWHAAKTGSGYPKVRAATPEQPNGTLDVHRRVCEEVNPCPGPGRFDASHLCETRTCVNPSHLTWEPHIENMQRVKRGLPRDDLGRVVRETYYSPLPIEVEGYDAAYYDDVVTLFS